MPVTKQEILDYSYENYELPEEGIPVEYFSDETFVSKLLRIDGAFMESFPIDIQKELIIQNIKVKLLILLVIKMILV